MAQAESRNVGVDGQVAWLLAAPWRHGASQVPTPHVVLPSAQWTPVFSEIEGRCVALACPVAGDPGSRGRLRPDTALLGARC